MRVIFRLALTTAVIALAGCASRQDARYASPSELIKSQPKPIVKPSDVITGTVISVNAVGRFVVLSFPVIRMPAVGQTLFLYREGLKIGEVKITDQQLNDKVVADLIKGEAKPGDEARDR